jgi:enoyl-[acyl-carrier protein] reductase II
MHPRLDQLVDTCLAAKVSHIVFAGGIPPGTAIKKAKDGGAKVICFAPALALAKRLIRAGADALVIEGSEAGGHIGPVSLTVLAQEILPHIRDVPVFVAGGIGRGEAILSYLEMGAAGVQLGTRFVCARESIAHANFKQAFIRGNARDAMPTIQLDENFPVIPVRALQNEGTKRFLEHQAETIRRFQSGELTKEAAQLDIEHFWAGALRRAVIEGDVENGSLMAGQSVGMVTQEQSAAEIIAELRDQAAQAILARSISAAA